MRAKYYALTLRQMNLKRSFVFFLVLVILCFIILYLFNSKLRPTIRKVCESNAQKIAVKCSNDAIYNNIDNVTYDDLVTLNKDNNGKVTSLTANSVEINKLTSKITGEIENNLQQNCENKVILPIGMIFDENIFSGYGPKIKLKTFPVQDIKTELKSTFQSAGINQTKHSLMLEISVDVKIIAPFVSETQEYKNSIIIAETIIVSDTPSSYYNISGVDGVNMTDTMPKVSN